MAKWKALMGSAVKVSYDEILTWLWNSDVVVVIVSAWLNMHQWVTDMHYDYAWLHNGLLISGKTSGIMKPMR